MGQKAIIFETIITSTIYVDEEDIEGMTDRQVKDMLQDDPEMFGRDDDPYIEDHINLKVENCV